MAVVGGCLSIVLYLFLTKIKISIFLPYSLSVWYHLYLGSRAGPR